MKQVLPLIFIVIVGFVSCAKKQEATTYPLPKNAVQLIAGDSVKTWKIARRYNGDTRMNMDDCFMHYKQTFKVDKTVKDNNEDAKFCGPSLQATWEITTTEKGNSYIKLTSDQIPELMGIEKDFKFFKIRYLSKDSLTISFVHNQFGTKKTIIDYLVRDDIEVPDRDFHW